MATRYHRRRSFNRGNDRISSLPDSLLIQVLSFLPTKQVVRASVLSKRWLGLWKNVPVIDIEISQDEPRELAILDESISLHASPKIDKLHLSVGHSRIGEGLSTRLDSVVRSAVARHVDDLTLRFSSATGYTLPWEVYTCGSLRVLVVTGCWFSPGERALQAWRTLRVLDVADATWSDGMVASVVARLPALESLRLRRFRGITRVDVSSPATKLKELVMENCLDALGGGELCICAPHLQELKLLGEWRSLRPRLVNVPSLVNVELGLEMREFDEVRDINTVRKLLEMVRLCQQLKVGFWCLQVLGLINPNFVCASFSRLKCLFVDTDIDLDQNLPALRNLFRCSPNLEILIISFNDCPGKLRDSPGLLSLEPLGCLLPKVKIVELHRLGELWFDLAKCLLKNMAMLEKMIIYQHPFIRILGLLELAKDLLALKRSSPRAVVIIQ